MNFNPSPKSEFIKDAKAVANHHTLVENDILRNSLNVALMEMSRRLTANPPTDLGGAGASYLRLLGAQEFLHEFLNLAERPAPVERPDNANLASNVSTARK